MNNVKARQVLSEVYGLDVDSQQALAEVQSLARKQDKGGLDDFSGQIVARLETAYQAPLRELALHAVMSWPSSTR